MDLMHPESVLIPFTYISLGLEMKIGLFLLNFSDSQSDSGIRIKYMESMAKYIDDLGFDRLLVSENHFSSAGIIGSPLTASGFLLGLTEKIKIGSLNHIITTHHPIRVAEEVCLLDNLSEGRFVFGFGDCEKLDEMIFFNRPGGLGIKIFEECYAIIDEALATGYCHPDGAFYSFPRISVNPHSYTEGGSPRYVMATSNDIVEWAAQKGIPLIFKWDDSNEIRGEYAERYKTAANGCGIDAASIDHWLSLLVNVNENIDEARMDVCSYISDYVLKNHSNEDSYKKMCDIISANAVGDYAACLASVKFAIDQCGAKGILLSFESMRDWGRQEKIISTINDSLKHIY